MISFQLQMDGNLSFSVAPDLTKNIDLQSKLIKGEPGSSSFTFDIILKMSLSNMYQFIQAV